MREGREGLVCMSFLRVLWETSAPSAFRLLPFIRVDLRSYADVPSFYRRISSPVPALSTRFRVPVRLSPVRSLSQASLFGS
jgi:hypothetical protein